MMLPLVLAFAAVVQADIRHDVAYVAKYYGSDAKSARYQVYLCDLHGNNQLRLTNNTRNYGSVRWVNNQQLACVEQGATDDSLHVYDTKTQEDKLIQQFSKGASPKLMTHPYVGINVCLLRTGNAPYSYFEVTSGGLKRISSPDTSAYRYSGKPVSFDAAKKYAGLDKVVGTSARSITWTFSKGMRTIDLSSDPGQGYFEAFQPNAEDELWVNLWSGNDQAGYRNDLYVLNFARETATPMATDAFDLSFHFDSRYWTGVTSYYRYASLSDGSKVKVNTGMVGDRITGKKWPITEGRCYVRSIALLPGM